MLELTPEEIAEAAGAEIVRRGEESSPQRAVVDSRDVAAGDLFVALRGERDDGGEFAASALQGGAWGALVEPDRALSLEGARGWVLAADAQSVVVRAGANFIITLPAADSAVDLTEGALAVNKLVNVVLHPGASIELVTADVDDFRGEREGLQRLAARRGVT